MSAWARAALGEVCDVNIGRTPARNRPEFWGGEHAWLSIADMNQGRALRTTKESITAAAIEECNCKLVEAGTVLLSFKLSIGKVGITDIPVFTNEAIASLPIRDSRRLCTEYLYWALKSIDLTRGLDRAAKGLTLNKAKLLDIEIPLPLLAEQRRIVEVLNRAEVLQGKRRFAVAQLDNLGEAVFSDLFGSHRQTPVTIGDKLEVHPRGWRWELLTDVARLATGHTPDRKRPDYWNGEFPWITLTEIRRLDGEIAKHTTENITQKGIDKSSAVKLPAGTVCFSRTASVGFVTVMGREMTTSQDFVNWVSGPRLEPVYLMHAFLRSRARLRSLSTGSTHKTIYFPTVEQFRVLVPPLAVQREFIRRLTGVENLKRAHHASLVELDALFGALEHRAFQGEL